MNATRLAFFPLLVALASSCSSSTEPEMFHVPLQQVSEAALQTPIVQTRRLVQTVSLQVLSEDSDSMATQARTLAQSHGGYLENLNATRGDSGTIYDLTLRIPADRLDAAVDQIKKLAREIRSETRTTEDVTSKVIDLEARTRALRLTEQQLEELLAESRTAGRDAEGIMTIFRELTSVREQRESLQGQLSAVNDRVALSKVTLRISPLGSEGIGIEWGFAGSVRDAVQRLLVVMRGLTSLAVNLVIVGVPLAAILAIVAVATLGVWRRIREFRAKPPSRKAS